MEKRIKYSYCVDKDNRLVHISELTDETRHSQTWRCLQCGQEMTPKLGEKNAKHFAHKANTACDGESYFHKLAKRRIREKFLSSDSFPITFVKDIPCSEHKECPFFNKYCYTKNVAIPCDLKKWEGQKLYDDCQEEIQVGEFRPDLLLTNLKKPNREPIFIEINVTHQSEEKKLKSKYRIIETKSIKSEDDIEDIVNRGFVESIDEGGNCETYNFSPKFPPITKETITNRFVFFKDGEAKLHKDVSCTKRNKRIISDSICELNMNIEFEGKNTLNNILSFLELGLAYIVKKKELKIRNCILCKNRNKCYFKCLGLEMSRILFPHQSNKDCPFYQINQKIIDKYPLSELEKIILEVPI